MKYKYNYKYGYNTKEDFKEKNLLHIFINSLIRDSSPQECRL